MQITELAELVKNMRTEQRNYFRYRTPDHLKESKKLEQAVDAAINQILPESTGSKFCGCTQHPKLF